MWLDVGLGLGWRVQLRADRGEIPSCTLEHQSNALVYFSEPTQDEPACSKRVEIATIGGALCG
jgi:hypothetical protein